MPTDPTIASRLLIDTDYPLDKIIYMATGSFTVNGMASGNSTVAHGLPFTPLLDGTWSTDSTFESISYDMGSGPASTVSGALFNIAPEVSATATNAIVSAVNATGSPITVYYRVFGFEPSNVNLEAPSTRNLADSFVLNTDYNYTKLFDAGTVTATSVILHNIGHRPQVTLWEESSGTIRKKNENHIPEASLAAFSDLIRVSVDTTSMTVTYDPFAPSDTIHYRMYLDE